MIEPEPSDWRVVPVPPFGESLVFNMTVDGFLTVNAFVLARPEEVGSTRADPGLDWWEVTVSDEAVGAVDRWDAVARGIREMPAAFHQWAVARSAARVAQASEELREEIAGWTF